MKRTNPIERGLDEAIATYVLDRHGVIIGLSTAADVRAPLNAAVVPTAAVTNRTASSVTVLGLDQETGGTKTTTVDRAELNRYVDELVLALDWSDDGRAAIEGCRTGAAQLHHPYIGQEHLIDALFRLELPGMRLVAEAGGSLGAARLKLDVYLVRNPAPRHVGPAAWTFRAVRAINLARQDAIEAGLPAVDSESLVVGVLAEGEGLGANALAATGLGLASVRNVLAATRAKRT